jgi:hypothetical protein
MGSTLGYQDFTISAGLGLLGLKTTLIGVSKGSFIGSLIIGAASLVRGNYYNNIYGKDY